MNTPAENSAGVFIVHYLLRDAIGGAPFDDNFVTVFLQLIPAPTD